MGIVTILCPAGHDIYTIAILSLWSLAYSITLLIMETVLFLLYRLHKFPLMNMNEDLDLGFLSCIRDEIFPILICPEVIQIN